MTAPSAHLTYWLLIRIRNSVSVHVHERCRVAVGIGIRTDHRTALAVWTHVHWILTRAPLEARLSCRARRGRVGKEINHSETFLLALKIVEDVTQFLEIVITAYLAFDASYEVRSVLCLLNFQRERAIRIVRGL